jgi:hypothetical protein
MCSRPPYRTRYVVVDAGFVEALRGDGGVRANPFVRSLS